MFEEKVSEGLGHVRVGRLMWEQSAGLGLDFVDVGDPCERWCCYCIAFFSTGQGRGAPAWRIFEGWCRGSMYHDMGSVTQAL
jgi:hypothetical protein